MSVDLVLTFVGPDKTGLVEDIAETVAAHGGNWLESRMTRLAGRFAGVLRVAVAPERAPLLHGALEHLADGLTVVVQEVVEPKPRPGAVLVHLDVLGNDRPGIIRDLAARLTSQGVNVEEMETECKSAPMSGQAIFHVIATVALPEGLALEGLMQELEGIGHDLMVEMTLLDTDQ